MHRKLWCSQWCQKTKHTLPRIPKFGSAFFEVGLNSTLHLRLSAVLTLHWETAQFIYSLSDCSQFDSPLWEYICTVWLAAVIKLIARLCTEIMCSIWDSSLWGNAQFDFSLSECLTLKCEIVPMWLILTLRSETRLTSTRHYQNVLSLTALVGWVLLCCVRCVQFDYAFRLCTVWLFNERVLSLTRLDLLCETVLTLTHNCKPNATVPCDWKNAWEPVISFILFCLLCLFFWRQLKLDISMASPDSALI